MLQFDCYLIIYIYIYILFYFIFYFLFFHFQTYPSFSIWLPVMIWSLFYCMLSFLIFSYRLISFYVWIPFIMWWWLMSHDPLPYVIYGNSLNLPLSAITHNLFISAGSYVLLLFFPIFHPLSIWLGQYQLPLWWPHAGLTSFIPTLWSFFYFTYMQPYYCKLVVYTCNHLLST